MRVAKQNLVMQDIKNVSFSRVILKLLKIKDS